MAFLVALLTGSQGEPRAALSRIAMDEHPEIALSPGDRVIFSSRTIPGNEKAVGAIQNALARDNIEIITDRQALDAGSESPLPEAFHTLVEFSILASVVDPFDPMEKAFHQLGERFLTDTEHLHRDWRLVQTYALSPALRAMSHVWAASVQGVQTVAAKGAPEAIAAELIPSFAPSFARADEVSGHVFAHDPI